MDATACPISWEYRVDALDEAVAGRLYTQLRNQFRNTRFEVVKPSELKGLVVGTLANGNAMYLTEDGRYAIFGFIMDLKNGKVVDNLLDGAATKEPD